jgi:hypothetical protein
MAMSTNEFYHMLELPQKDQLAYESEVEVA